MNGSKWAWIENKCFEKGFFESQKLAQEIENGLIAAYGASDTEEWRLEDEDNVDNLFEEYPRDLFGDVETCRGCFETAQRGCDNCKFAEICGRCDGDESAFTRFNETFEKERGKSKQCP